MRPILRVAAVVALGLVALGAAAAPDPWKEAARYTIAYEVDLPALDITPEAKVRVWLPLPVETQDQEIVSEQIDSPWPTRITEDANGNRVAYVEGRGRPDGLLALRAVVERSPSTGISKGAVREGGPDDPERFGDGARLIPLDGLIRQVAEQQSAGLETKDEKVRRFYDYVVESMSYDKSGTGWGQGNAIWACSNKRGNCTDFHSLFIGMARSQDIPARFVIGLPVPDSPEGPIGGYHCWAEFWDDDRGWVPVDSSEAKKRDLADAYYGRLPNDRVEFTTGRDLLLEPRQSGEPLNYFIYPYVEVDGKPLDDVPARFAFERHARS